MLNPTVPLRPASSRQSARSRGVARFAGLIAAVGVFANSQAGQLLVAAANSQNNATYELTRASNSTPLISGTAPLNSDGARHGRFDSLVWVPNAATGTLDLIAADSGKQQIVRYSGPNYGTASTLYSWSGQGHGPAQPDGLSVDSAGNLFVVSSSCGSDGAPSLWVLPVNSSGGYGAPILIDHNFGGAPTVKLAETVVAGISTSHFNAGDLLVLVGDTANARVIVYSHQAIANVLAHPSQPLSGPSATVITWSQFLVNFAVPTGMDVWPADASHGTSLLITTIDGRILRFDTAISNFTPTPFTSGLGVGLQRIKVASFANTPYAFAAQQGGGGQILEFGAPPANGPNKPIAVISKGVDDPDGLAVTGSSGSAPASACVYPKTCDLLGGALTHQISGPGASKVGGVVLEQSCIVAADPRVTVAGSNWSCNGNSTLDVANYCPGFPHTVIPGSLCGHAGPSGSGFAVIKATADGVDPVDNDSFVTTQSGLSSILPGPLNLTCQQVPQIPVLAWAPRSDLPGIEGTIVEDSLSPFFVEMTGFCDDGGANLRGLSMYALGLAVNNTQSVLPTGLTGYVDTKYGNLQSTITGANINGNVSAALQSCVNQSQADFNAGVAGAANGYSCAAYQLSTCDAYVRANLGSFSSNLHPNGGNPNPAGDIDGRLANLFLTINTRVAHNAPNAGWPAANVPACVTLTAPATATTGSQATLSWTAYGVPAGASCALSSSDGKFNNTAVNPNGSASTGALAAGSHTYQLTCPGTGGSSGKSTAAINVSGAVPVVITSFTAAPGTVANGNAAALSWTVTGLPSGSYCTLSATDGTYHTANTHEGATGSGVSTGTLTATPTYTATLSCPGAAAKTAGVTVQPAPLPVTITGFTATPGSVANGSAASLAWTVTNLPGGSSCTLSATDGAYQAPQSVGATSPPAGASTGALTATPTYTATLSCPNGAATVTRSVVVGVAAPMAPTISFSASPTGVLYGGTSSLTWTATGVPTGSTCTLGASDGTYATPASTNVAASGTNVSTGALTITPNYTATLNCPGTGGTSAQKTVAVTVTVPFALNNPEGLAFGPNGNLYVANSGAGQVLVYAPSGGKLVQQPSLTLSGFATPVALAFDGQGDLYVADAGNGLIQVYTPAGLASNTASSAAAIQVDSPGAVTVDNQGYVYVASNSDSASIFVYQYQPAADQPALSNPVQISSWYQDANGFFQYAPSLAFDGTHVLAGIDAINNYLYTSEIEVYSPQALQANGGTLTPTLSLTVGVNEPSGIAFDSSHNVYVSQYGADTVNDYTSTGAAGNLALSAIPNGGYAPSQYPFLIAPGGVALDSAGLIYVANTPNNTIDVYNAAGVFQYEFLPLVSVAPPVSNDANTLLTWTWTSLGEPANAPCTLSDTNNSGSKPEPPSGTDTTAYTNVGYDNGTVTCPGATGSASLGGE